MGWGGVAVAVGRNAFGTGFAGTALLRMVGPITGMLSKETLYFKIFLFTEEGGQHWQHSPLGFGIGCNFW